MRERLDLIQKLNAIPPETFNMVIFALNPPPGLVAPMLAPQGQRSQQLLQWAESPGGSTLRPVLEIIEELTAPHASQ